MKFLTEFTYRNLHDFARFPGDSTALYYCITEVGPRLLFLARPKTSGVQDKPRDAAVKYCRYRTFIILWPIPKAVERKTNHWLKSQET